MYTHILIKMQSQINNISIGILEFTIGAFSLDCNIEIAFQEIDMRVSRLNITK